MQNFLVYSIAYLRFFTRIPIPVQAFERGMQGPPDITQGLPAVPVVGAFIGGVGALVLAIAIGLGLPATLAAILAVAVLAAITGALHEDGLADVADGFGGGRDRVEKLAIMKDSRLGSYGAVALLLALMARVLALAAVVQGLGLAVAVLGLIVTAAAARTAALLPLLLLPPARTSGISASLPSLNGLGYLGAWTICLAMACVAALGGAGWRAALLLPAGALLAAWLVTQLAQRQIQGHTGDVCGAAEQMAEVACLLVLAAAAGA